MKIIVVLTASFLLMATGCKKEPEIDPATAKQMLVHRNLGLAFLEEGKLHEAAAEFQALAAVAPWEPLGHANLGLTCLRLQELEQAEKSLQQALKLEPDHPDIRLLLARVYEFTGRENEALRILENTLEKHPNHVRTLYQLVQHYLNAQNAESRLKAENCLSRVVNNLPANVAAALQLVELYLQNGKATQALELMEAIRQILPELPEGSQEIFQKGLEFMQRANLEQALVAAHMFHNLLKPTSFYQAAITELRGAGDALAGEPISRFSSQVLLHLQERTGIPVTLSFTEATSASGLTLVSPGEIADRDDVYPQIIIAHGDYDGDGDQDVFLSQWLPGEQTSRQNLFTNENGTFSEVANKTGISHAGRDLHALFADYDNDGYLDLFITNTRSHRLYRNTGAGTFHEVTSVAGIKTDFEGHAAAFADLDHDGDLDLFVTASSHNRWYRNNSDGTFTERAEEAGLSGAQALSHDAVFGDFDDDGDLDLFVISQNGSNKYFDNLRQGYFREIAGHAGLESAGGSGAVAAGDYDNDGYVDLFVADLTGRQHSLFHNRGDGTFERDVRSDSAFASMHQAAGRDAAFFDADNDGFLDLLVAGVSQDTAAKHAGLWLFYNDGNGKYLEASSLLPELAEAGSQVEVMDYDNDGDLDILLAGTRGLHLLRNDGGNVNNYLVVRLAGLRTGSSKNNYFGIGSKLEVKAGDLTQMRVMSEPLAHFGLGNRDSAEVVRVVWSNGVAQNWFRPEKNQTITEDQILKGSCPWLYAWNGREYEFVTDVLWTSALGMPLGIMGKEIGYAFANSGQDYFKIPGEKLLPRNGKYLLQFTSELWEASFVDRIKLLIVDHPESIEVFVDEKFMPPPFPALRVYAVADRRLPLSAHDDKGNDVLPKIARQDGEYISNLIPAKYQGITEPHDLILDLGNLAAADSIFLFLQGWIFPTDASINVNTSQSNALRATPPCLQVMDEKGRWKTVIENMGFPKGKNKMMVFDLSRKFLVNDYRVRIRTNMQIYWDHVFYATDVTASTMRIAGLEPVAAELHYRGFSEVTRATPYSPHVPNYQVVTTAPKWRDLTGSYTRYGEVLPLLLESDSKYVIMNAGDELTLSFDAEENAELPAGWKRDFIFHNDGWVKDGDLNTAHGQTVEPLPFQEMTCYPYGPEESYPGDEEHASYFQIYNIRKTTSETFKRAYFEGKR